MRRLPRHGAGMQPLRVSDGTRLSQAPGADAAAAVVHRPLGQLHVVFA